MTDPVIFPQFAKTCHPEVLEAVRVSERRWDEFLEKMRDVSEKYTGERHNGYFFGDRCGSAHMTGVRASQLIQSAPGQWKKPIRGVTEPYSNNPARADFNIRYRAEPIPGRGNFHMSSGYMGSGMFFIHEGYAYSHYGFFIERGEAHRGEAEAYGWEEIMPSELHKALDDYNSNRKAGKILGN